MKIEVFDDQILLEELKFQRKSAGGILVGTEVKQRPGCLFAKVLSIGKGITKVKVDDIVITHKGKLLQFELPEKTIWIAPEEKCIMAICQLEEGDSIK